MRNEARGRGRGRGNRKLDKLLCLKDMRRSNACAGRAYIKGLGELDELDSQGVGAPQEYRDLDADTGAMPLLGVGHGVLGVQNLSRHSALFSTVELVRRGAYEMPDSGTVEHCKLLIMNELNRGCGGSGGICGRLIRKCPESFPNCANGTDLPLTVLGPDGSIGFGRWENNCHFRGTGRD
jgi:hypothetical protein